MQILFNHDFHFDSELFFTHQHFTVADKPFPKHSHDFFEFFLITRGRVLHSLNDCERYLERGDLQFIRPADTHQLFCVPGTGQIDFYNCNIRTDLFLAIFHFFLDNKFPINEVNQTIHLSEEQLSSLIPRFEKILQLQSLVFANRNRLEGRILFADLLYLLAKNYLEEETAEPEWLQNLMVQMQSYENLKRGLPALFQLSGKSQEHVSRSMRVFWGITPQEFVLNLRLQTAAQELCNSSNSIAMIAFSVGFGNLSYFHSAFRKKYGVSPGVYRKNYIHSFT